MELDRMRAAGPADRRRYLRSASRLAAPSQRTVELTAAGDDYAVLAEAAESDGFEANWPVLRDLFEDAPERLTRKQVLDRWPDDHDLSRPSPATLRRWLERAVAGGLVEVRGTGRRSAPFRYGLPGREYVLEELDPLPPLGGLIRNLREDRASRRG